MRQWSAGDQNRNWDLAVVYYGSQSDGQKLFPDAKLGIGPPITDGFYYEFDVPEPFTPEDLKAIEKEAIAIAKSGQEFRRRVVTEDQAVAELANEPYKLRLIGSDGGAEVMEVGGLELTVYDNVDRKIGRAHV